MDAVSSGNDSDAEPMSTEMLADINNGSQYHSIINRREACYKIRDHIKKSQSPKQNMGKGLHKSFKAVANDILQVLPILGESDSEVYYFIP